MNRKSHQYATQLLDKLRKLDHETMGAYYDMGQILSSIAHGQLWVELEYSSLGAMIDEELSFTRSTGYKYMWAFRNFRRLKYTKTQALELMSEFGFTHVAEFISGASQKVSTRTVRKHIREMIENTRQINFTLSKREHQQALQVLAELGCTVGTHGRREHSSEAFMRLVGSFRNSRMEKRSAA